MTFDRFLFVMTRPWVVVSYVIFIILSYIYLDRWVAIFMYHLDLKRNVLLLLWLTNLGSDSFYLLMLLLMALLFRFVYVNKTSERHCWFLWLCVFIPCMIALILKIVLGRARPELLFNQQLYGFFGLKFQRLYWSMPSGHATTIMGLIFGFIILLPRYFYTFLLVGLLVVLSRVLLTEHYLSDVMLSFYLALIEVGLLTYWLRKKQFLGMKH